MDRTTCALPEILTLFDAAGDTEGPATCQAAPRALALTLTLILVTLALALTPALSLALTLTLARPAPWSDPRGIPRGIALARHRTVTVAAAPP